LQDSQHASRRAPRTRRIPAAALLIVLAISSATACGRGPAPEQATGITTVAVADRVAMPTITGPTLADATTDGPELDIASLTGHPIVLNSWASWCAPCRDEIPHLIHSAAANPDVRFVGLNVKDDRVDATAFRDQTGIPWPSIVDPQGTLLPSIPGVPPAALPSTVVIDRHGRIAARIIGPVAGPELDEVLQDLRAED